MAGTVVDTPILRDPQAAFEFIAGLTENPRATRHYPRSIVRTVPVVVRRPIDPAALLDEVEALLKSRA